MKADRPRTTIDSFDLDGHGGREKKAAIAVIFAKVAGRSSSTWPFNGNSGSFYPQITPIAQRKKENDSPPPSVYIGVIGG